MSQDKKISQNNAQDDFSPPPSRKEEQKILVWRKIIPNSLTAMAIFVGVSAINCALHNRFDYAVVCIIMSGLLDGLDGPVARALHGASRFGAELDSLADYVNFGVSPSIVLFLWDKENFGYLGWVVCVIYTVCMACRLARFNAGVDFNASAATRNFFMGVPAPGGAYLLSLPLIYTFAIGEQSDTQTPFSNFIPSPAFVKSPIFVFPYILVISFLLVSEIPTFSSKMIKRSAFSKTQSKLLLISVIILLVILGTKNHWLCLLVGQIAYFSSFPVSYALFKLIERREKDKSKTN